MPQNSPSPPICIDTQLRLGPALVRLKLTARFGDQLTEADMARRLGPFMVSPEGGTDQGEEDIEVVLETTEGPWPRPGRRFNTLTALQEPEGWRLRRDDLDTDLQPSVLSVKGECMARLQAVEECTRFLLWLYLTRVSEGGLLIHSATVVDEGLAYCFPAYGGTGKSTLAASTPGEVALSDELSLLTLEEGQWRAWPCPFWNWPRNVAPDIEAVRSYPLAGLGFLKQAPLTHFESLRADQALTELMAQAVAFDAFPLSSSKTFNLAADLVQALRQKGRVGRLHLLKGDDPFAAMRAG